MDRRRLLERGPISVGEAWARAFSESVKTQGQSVAGGWPGTIVEARARIAWHLRQELEASRMDPLSKDELEVAARTTYTQAKKEWLQIERSARAAARASLARS